jgi:hypothetical protein
MKMASKLVVAATGMTVVLGILLGAPSVAEAQGLTFNKGQSISPAFEGWTENADGTFNLMFGYMNRNWEEQPDVPVGSENYFSPGPQDRGQNTHFLPRRNRFVFEVRVPADFGEQELMWTLVVNGVEQLAYGHLGRDYFVDNVVIMSENGALGAGSSNPELRAHTPPVVEMETPAEIEAVVGRPVRLVATISDDGLPRRRGGSLPIDDEGNLDLARALRAPPSRITPEKIMGLNISWHIFRGPDGGQDAVSFNPPQPAVWEDTRPFSNSPWAPFWIPPELPEDGVWVTEVTFSEPGTYLLRGRADDGGLYTDREILVTVRPPVL